MPAPHRDFAAEEAAERSAQSLHEIAVAAENFRLAISRLGQANRATSVALTHIDTAELWAEKALRGYVAPPAGGGL